MGLGEWDSAARETEHAMYHVTLLGMQFQPKFLIFSHYILVLV